MANVLKKKLGPLPVWAWALIAVGLLVGYKLFSSGQQSSSTTAGGYTTDEYGNVYDANGNLVMAAPTATAPQTSMGGVTGGGNGGSTDTTTPVATTVPDPAAYGSGYIDALTAAEGLFNASTPSTAPAPGPESPAPAATDVGALLASIFGTLASPAVQGSATPVTAPVAPAPQVSSTGGAVRYYTYKNQVPLAAGETLHFTPGRGYYAYPAGAGAPAPPIIAPHSVPTPPSVVLAHPSPLPPHTPAPVTHHYYTYKKDVPLGAGQTLHFTTGKGYYAA